MRAIGSYMTKNILILFAFVLLASTSNWVPLYTDGTLTGGGYEDSPLGVDTSKVATTYDLMSAASGASYLVYTALLTQSGTDAPVATVLENTLGGTVTWSYVGAGSYRATLTGAFPSGKFFAFPDYWSIPTDGGSFMAIFRSNDDSFILETGNDGYLGYYSGVSPIEVRVYP